MRNFILLLTFVSCNAQAWGPTGHRTVGEVAEKYLRPEVKEKIQSILDNQSLARVSTWPDEIKSEPATYSHTYSWHYTDWPDEMHQHDETNSFGKLMTSIAEQTNILKDPKTIKVQKAFAVKFIVHLIGDLHMPLHVGNGQDQGGNLCKVIFQGKTTNLHALWDEGMIDFTNLSFTELTRFTTDSHSAQVEEWKKGTPLDWAQESKDIRGTIYPADVNPAPNMSSLAYCRGNEVVEKDMPRLSYEYSYKFLPVVEKRLYQAGVRLAVILNSAL